MLPGPFLGWLGTLMFLLLMQFLIRYLPDLVGKGLPPGVLVELVAYNLAYMVVLAVPMSALIATLMTFGKLAEDATYAVAKSAGISLPQLAWPALVAGLLLTGCMWYFNNEVLPEANFRARGLWQDIRKKKPGFDLQAGVFYRGLDGYFILVQDIPPESNELVDVLIYDYTDGSQQRASIKAREGHLEADPSGAYVDLVLRDGQMNQRAASRGEGGAERYERVDFGRHRLRLDLSDFAFERSDPDDGYRSDRTMRTEDMVLYVDSLEASIAEEQATLYRTPLAEALDSLFQVEPPPTSPLEEEPAELPVAAVALADSLDIAADSAAADSTARAILAGLLPTQQQAVYDGAMGLARRIRTDVDNVQRTVTWEAQRADKYRVEIHKKRSIAIACLIFVLIGAPLGLSVRRGGLGVGGALALGIFLFYWVTLVQGEKLADRDMLAPWIGMWIANIVMTLVGTWLAVYVTMDLRATPPLWRRLLRR